MIDIWPQTTALAERIQARMAAFDTMELPETFESPQGVQWNNWLWHSDFFRRAHMEIVDARESRGIWVMHMTIFPHLDCPDPIFGLDLVCGAHKITGAFHDFSRVSTAPNALYQSYQDRMYRLHWVRNRELPDWAQAIFSPEMVAVSNINTQVELNQLIDRSEENLETYLNRVGTPEPDASYAEQHNFYCQQQKLNPRTPDMMVNLGVDAAVFARYMDTVLFPEVQA